MCKSWSFNKQDDYTVLNGKYNEMFLSGELEMPRIKISVTRINYSCGGNRATANNGQKRKIRQSSEFSVCINI